MGAQIGEVISRSEAELLARAPRPRADPRRHEQRPLRRRRETARDPGLPHGGRQPLLRLARAGGEEPPDHRPLSDFLLPYTERSRANLLREGFPGQRVYVIGNPIKEVLEHSRPQIAASDVLARLDSSAAATCS